jgi:FkbM family methyltransferase
MSFLKSIERHGKKLLPKRWRKYLRASHYELVMERMSPVDFIIHVGAHWGEDAARYEGFGAKTVLWVEADPETYAKLVIEMAKRDGQTRHLTECALVSASDAGAMGFHRFSGDGASSSVHQATQGFKDRFAHVGETGEVLTIQSRTLPDILSGHGVDVSDFDRPMLVLDVQGHEMSVLQGLGDALRKFDLCKCEVSQVPMYEGGAEFGQIDAHMKAHGFKLASHRYALVPKHGDVLYVKA